MDERDHAYFGRDQGGDQIGIIDDMRAIFGSSYADEPHRLVEQLRADEAIAEALRARMSPRPQVRSTIRNQGFTLRQARPRNLKSRSDVMLDHLWHGPKRQTRSDAA